MEKPDNDPLTASCLVLQKGKGQGLYDLLADESFEKGIKECFTRGKYQRQLLERVLLWQENGASVFGGEGLRELCSRYVMELNSFLAKNEQKQAKRCTIKTYGQTNVF